MIEIKINKRKIEKASAKIVWAIMQIITAISIIFLLASIGTMIEAWKIENIPFAVCLVCLAWIKFFSSFVTYANKEKR